METRTVCDHSRRWTGRDEDEDEDDARDADGVDGGELRHQGSGPARPRPSTRRANLRPFVFEIQPAVCREDSS